MNSAAQLDRLFHPGAVAVIGASANPDKVGFMCLNNLVQSGFPGNIYPVNPGKREVLGLPAYPSISSLPGTVDLAVVVIPAGQAVAATAECAERGVPGVVIISGGFREVNTPKGFELERQLCEIAAHSDTRIIGPNTLGIFNMRNNLVASFQSTLDLSQKGCVAVATQSGGMCGYITHALNNNRIGISKALGLGNRCDLDFDEVVAYLAEDKDTRVIAMYIEGLEQPGRLLQATGEAAPRKPVLVFKGGRSQDSSQATVCHTGALAGEYAFYRAAFRQAGMMPVDSITELADCSKALTLQSPPAGNKVAIISVQAGPAIVIADRCRELGLSLSRFTPATQKRLRKYISPQYSIDNPIDIAWESGDLVASREILQAALEDEGVDAIIVAAIFHTANMELMQAAIEVAGIYQKPVVACLDSPQNLGTAQIAALEENGIPTYPLPERAATGLASLVRYGEILGRK